MQARSRLGRIFADRAKVDPQTAQDLVYIDQALPHSITIEMALALYAIAEKLAGLGISDAKDLNRRLEAGDLPPEVMEAWQTYMAHFGGYRENHKYYLVRIISFLRRRVLQEAENLLAAARLDRPEQIFDLTFDDLARAHDDPSIDLRQLIQHNTPFLKKLDLGIKIVQKIVNNLVAYIILSIVNQIYDALPSASAVCFLEVTGA